MLLSVNNNLELKKKPYKRGVIMSLSHAQGVEEKHDNSSNYIKVNIWGGRIGHASLEVSSEKGNDYLSLWPNSVEEDPRRATNLTYEEDCLAEARRNEVKREPEGVYILSVSEEDANSVFNFIQDTKLKVKNDVIRYTLLNQSKSSLDEKNQENYNCSGIVEKAISQTLKIDFGDPRYSEPKRVSQVMLSQPNTKVEKHDESILGKLELPFQENLIRARL